MPRRAKPIPTVGENLLLSLVSIWSLTIITIAGIVAIVTIAEVWFPYSRWDRSDRRTHTIAVIITIVAIAVLWFPYDRWDRYDCYDHCSHCTGGFHLLFCDHWRSFTIATIAKIDSDSIPAIVIVAIIGDCWQNENLVSIWSLRSLNTLQVLLVYGEVCMVA